MSSSGSEYEAESTNSDSSGETVEKPKVKTRRKKTAADEGITNLCRNYTCTACGKGFKSENTVQSHLRKCELHLKKRTQLTCNWCKLTFSNRGALAIHAFHLHGDTSYRSYTRLAVNEYACRICKQAFNTNVKLKFHIRRTHFNLKGRVPYAELKKVNQVWFEKVMNSNNVIEIKKTSDNMLVMKKIDENTVIKVNNDNEKIIDVTHIYPTELKRCNIRVKCKYCNKLYVKRDFKKHVDEIHRNKKKHYCNNCNRGFKRLYQFIKHVCNKSKTVKGVKKGNSNIVITSVNSLGAPVSVINID